MNTNQNKSQSQGNLTVRINFSGSEEEKVVLTGIIENMLKNTPLENKKNLNWKWFSV